MLEQKSERDTIIQKTKALHAKNSLNAPFKKYGEQFRMLYFSSGNLPTTKEGVLARSENVRKTMVENLYRQGIRSEINYLNTAVRKSIPCQMTQEDIKEFNIASGRIQKEVSANIIKERKMGLNRSRSLQRTKDLGMDF